MIRLSRQYPQRRAFVTGAASGFGLALCEALAADGWTLGLADIDAEGLDRAAVRLEAQGARSLPFVLDVSDADAFEQAAETFVARAGGADVLVNNAGIAVGGLLEATSIADWHAAVAVNLLGVVHGCHAFVPRLKRAGAGHVINVASIAAVAAGPYMAAYNATKAGVLSLSETLYSECKDAGVRISVVLPYFFQTNIATTARGDDAFRRMTEKLVQGSTVTAAEVAAYTLAEAGKGTLHILPARQARAIWRYKRLLPRRYFNKMVERARSTARFVAGMKKAEA